MDRDVPTPKQRIKMILHGGGALLDTTTALEEALIEEYDQGEAVKIFLRAGAPERVAVLLAQRLALGCMVLDHVSLSREGR